MPNTYDKGNLVRVSATFRDASGAAVDPTTVTFTLTDPALTTTTPSVTKDSTGNYHVDVSATLVGFYYYQFKGTGANQGADESSFEVAASHF